MVVSESKSDTECSRESILRNLHLRKIIKENHGQALVSLSYCESPDNLLATAGGSLLSVYDNNHCGSNLDLCCAFSNCETEYSKGGNLTDLVWVPTNSKPLEEEEEEEEDLEQDARLCFGSESGEIGLISLRESRVVKLLKGHSAAVLRLIAPRHVPWLLSCSKDNTVRVWDISLNSSENNSGEDENSCLAVWKFDSKLGCPTAIAVQGNLLAIGFAKGAVVLKNTEGLEIKGQPETTEKMDVDESENLVRIGGRGLSEIDCMEFTQDSKLVVHSVCGKIKVYDVALGQEVLTITVPKGSKSLHNTKSRRTRFGLSCCSTYLGCGNTCGEVFIFNLKTGHQVNKLSMPRIKGCVTAAAFSPDSQNLALCTDDSLLWRWDYKPNKQTNGMSE